MSYRNRGKTLECLIDMTNKQYTNQRRAQINKIPTPVKILKHTGNRVIGHTEKGELVDYIGVCGGRAIAFDAKQTKTKNLPLANIPQHQYNFLESYHNQGASSFLIVEFVIQQEIYYLPFEYLQKYWIDAEKGERKSIPYKYFQEKCEQIKSKNGYILDYISFIEEEQQ